MFIVYREWSLVSWIVIKLKNKDKDIHHPNSTEPECLHAFKCKDLSL